MSARAFANLKFLNRPFVQTSQKNIKEKGEAGRLAVLLSLKTRRRARPRHERQAQTPLTPRARRLRGRQAQTLQRPRVRPLHGLKAQLGLTPRVRRLRGR